MQTLRQELNETMENLRTMNVQYNNLETSAQVQLDVQKQTRLKLEQCNAYIVKLQNENQVLCAVNESAKRNERKVEEQKEHVQDLLEENKLLEDNLSKLCELQFVEDDEPAVVSTDHILEEQVIELEARDINNQTKIKELTEDNDKLVGSISALEDKCYQLEIGSDQLQAEVSEFKQKQLHMEDEETQTDPIHQVRKNNQGTQTLTLHVSSDNKLKSKFDRSSQTYNELDFTLDHCLQVDSSIKYNTMMEQSSKLDESSHEVSTQMDKSSNNHDDLTEGESSSDENKLLGGNVFEIVIKRAELYERFFSDEATTLVTLDYLDYKTMASNVVRGRFPNYEFSIKYDLSNKSLDKLKNFTAILRLCQVTSRTEYEAIATLTLNLINVIEDCNECKLSGAFDLVSTQSDEDVVGEIEVVAKLKDPLLKKNENSLPMVKVVESHDEHKEDMQEKRDDSIDTSEKLIEERVVNSNMSSVLKYFMIKKDHINYIDFLRFVDPPYPILKQIRFLQKIETGLTDILKSASNNSSDVSSRDETKHHISEEMFVQAVATQASSTRNIQLDEVCNLYRHVDIGNDKATTSHRILFFLYSSEMEELRRIFFSFRKSSIDPWRPFQVEDVERTGTVSKSTFNQCIRSIGIRGLVIQ